MNLDLAGHVAIVTGASRGIGEAIAQTLAGEGAQLALVARSGEALERIANSLEPNDAEAHLTLPVDLRDPDAAERVVAATLERFGRLDLLVNNAGATRRGDFLELTDADWADGYALKFFGAMRLCRAAWPHLRSSAGGIVNIAGVGGLAGSAEFTIGGSVNAAVTHLTKSLADRGVADGVRVNAINPGAIATERLQTRIRQYALEHDLEPNTASTRMAASLGVARFGQPEEIARVVAFLASPRSGFLHGAIVDVDGGQTRAL